MQFPKELQPPWEKTVGRDAAASMKCSSRRNCNHRPSPGKLMPGSLNEVQFPKELQPLRVTYGPPGPLASMKCSSRRNCNLRDGPDHAVAGGASMKCSSRRNCNCPLSIARQQAHLTTLRERSCRSLRLSPTRPLLSSPHSHHSNVLLPRALPRVLRAPERSRQAISGPSGVMVLVKPT